MIILNFDNILNNINVVKFILAVQHARDGLGKRLNHLKTAVLETPSIKILKPLTEEQQLTLNDESHNRFGQDIENGLTHLASPTINNNNRSENCPYTTTIADNTRLNLLQTPNLSANPTYSNAPTTASGSVGELLFMDVNSGSIFQLNGVSTSTANTNRANTAAALDGFMTHNLIDNFVDNKQISSYMV